METLTMECKGWHTDTALVWLTTLLQERFGHTFNLQQKGKSLLISLGTRTNFIELLLDGSTFTRSDSNLPCSQWNAASEGWNVALNTLLPTPGASALPSPLIQQTEQGYRIHYDILGLTYWILSRQEEVDRIEIDYHGRFPSTSSHAYKHGYLERPIVDEWLHVLGQIVQRTWPGIRIKQHNFSMKVSHDVDRPSRYGFRTWPGIAKAMASDVLRRRDIKSAALAPWIRMNTHKELHSLDPANTFDWIMDVSEQHGLTSAFYFICGRTEPAFDADYEPEHPTIRGLMRRIHERGHEIGLHPSYGTYQKPLLLKGEAERLRRIATEEGIEQSEWGGRMHYLRWQHPITLRAWADAGMSYDSTFGYADGPGFRCGTCFEYPAFDPVTRESLPLRVRPLVVMESSVIADGYLSLGMGDAAITKFLELKNTCRALGGWFTLLWHNSYFNTENHKYIYKQIITQ